MAPPTGEIHRRDEKDECVIEWKIQNFFKLPVDVIYCYYSPSFYFVNADWHLTIYSNCEYGMEERTELYLYRETDGPPVSLDYTLGLKTVNEDINPRKKYSHVFESEGCCEMFTVLSKSEFFDRKSELAPDNAVTVVCRLQYPANFKATGFGKAVTTNCSYCKKDLDSNENISSHYQECSEFPIKCPKCGEVVALKNCFEHKCQMKGAEGFDKAVTTNCSYCKKALDSNEDISSHHQECSEFLIKCPKCSEVVALKNCFDHKCQMTEAEVNARLLNDLKSMMLKGDHSDVIIKVKGEDFRLHRSILASRSPYFHSMFNCSMKEKSTGIVTIDDCESEVFRSYVHFIYTGKVDKLSLENICDLYELADKYQEDQLKNECLHFMMSTLSLESFCDFTILAFRHNEKELLENSIKFFASKTSEIIRSVKWQTLITEYPIQANELHIKVLDLSLGQ